MSIDAGSPLLSTSEIRPGLALYLDAEALIDGGAYFSCDDASRVRGGRYFLCLIVNGTKGDWLPLYSSNGENLEPVSRLGRTGDVKWTEGEFFYHSDQVWTATRDAIVVAATSGRDRSRPGRRNRLEVASLPRIE